LRRKSTAWEDPQARWPQKSALGGGIRESSKGRMANSRADVIKRDRIKSKFGNQMPERLQHQVPKLGRFGGKKKSERKGTDA